MNTKDKLRLAYAAVQAIDVSESSEVQKLNKDTALIALSAILDGPGTAEAREIDEVKPAKHWKKIEPLSEPWWDELGEATRADQGRGCWFAVDDFGGIPPGEHHREEWLAHELEVRFGGEWEARGVGLSHSGKGWDAWVRLSPWTWPPECEDGEGEQ